ncbi:hypothetical protein HYDPIDRAFT_99734 [Hydnomerulius pinastri MD-312]|uniref:Uncharacterized protein n=1 Tax=Hydnomerulius pinastri MD-312 TaxID=994086 RepID=A0A0C9V3R5_9AGAM|nr:hypothetical protein HYDPIDRAFT_99734 [Hydnomerulius pinastri MD-312]
MEQWGKVRRIEGGDTMNAAGMVKMQADSRDASFVRYETLVDKNARQRNAASIYEKKTFYGKLQHIFVVRVPAHHSINLLAPETIFFAAIYPCQLISTPSALNSLDIHFYSTLSNTLDIVDITCVQCLVGRIPIDGGRVWAVVDRSGDLARATFED